MKVAISVVRPFHVAMMANALQSHAESVSICTSTPRRYFKRLDPSVKVTVVPAPLEVANQFLPFNIPRAWIMHEVAVWDRIVAEVIPKADVVIGFAAQSLATGRTANRRGIPFVLDRACPHVDFQQQLMLEESAKVGAKFVPEPAWYHERQLEEYEIADTIVCPSDYSARSFPEHLRKKIVLAPLMGRTRTPAMTERVPHETFTVGVVGGMPLRKGYVYLLEAWKKLALPNAKLLIRSSGDFDQYPGLMALLNELPNVEIVGYVPDIADFYARCDVFVLPSVDDGFGMALFEGMVNGVPTISTRNCGASELLIHGQDGLIVDARSTEQLAEAILTLYRDPALRREIARAGRATAERVTTAALYEQTLWSGVSGTVAPLPLKVTA